MRTLFVTLLGVMSLSLGLAVAKDSPNVPVMAPTALNSYSSAPAHIASATVFDLNGEAIGRVTRLASDSAGKPQDLNIVLSAGVSISVAANNVSYDEQQNVVVIGLDHDEVARLSKPTK